jgi:hypothetical protein
MASCSTKRRAASPAAWALTLAAMAALIGASTEACSGSEAVRALEGTPGAFHGAKVTTEDRSTEEAI